MLNHHTYKPTHADTLSFGMVSVTRILIYKKVLHHGFRNHITVSRFVRLSYAVKSMRSTSED